MTEHLPYQGECLCGKVRISAPGIGNQVGVCHCAMCRRWSSGPYLALHAGTDVSISGREFLKVYDSSEWAERGFCSECGSNLYYRYKDSGEYMVAAGLFLPQPDWQLTQEVFIDHKPAYYNFAEKTEALTGAEAFARYAEGKG
ncbi:GFA family protein [Granulosicoccaceae sp. 1_MG-2023]|nr:GFA family protein [Granulosicoccaceae sp. 1_MG-2023]